MKLLHLFIILITIVFISGCVQSNQSTGSAVQNIPPNTVEITADGFSPNTLAVAKGTTITFINKDSQASWPASNVHPSHKNYPGSDIAKCNTDEWDSVFDACRELQQGETYSFMFNEGGSWTYHDHFNPRHTGTIVVE